MDGKEAKLTAQNWSRLGAVSLDTALRDIDDLDYEQFESGTLSSSDLVHKYMAYLTAL